MTLIAGAAFVELYFVLSSLFASKAYYAFGFLALTAGVVALTTATVSILFTYFLLCSEEYRYVIFSLSSGSVLTSLFRHRWHWRSFLIGGGSAFWVIAYGLFYWISRLRLGSLSNVILYLGYLLLLALLDFLITGNINSIPRIVQVLTRFTQERLVSWLRTGLFANCILQFESIEVRVIRRLYIYLDYYARRRGLCYRWNGKYK